MNISRLPKALPCSKLPPLQLVSQHIPTLDEKRKDDSNTSQERYTPQIRQRVRRPRNVQPIIRQPARQIPHTQRIQRLIRQFRDITNHHCRSKEPQVLKSILLCAFGADDLGFGCFVDALVALGVAGVRARILVVEFAERRGVEVWCDREEPGGGDGVEGLWLLIGRFMGFGGGAWCVRSFGGRRGCWRPW